MENKDDINEERKNQRAKEKTYKVRPSTVQVIAQANEISGGSVDDLLFTLANDYIQKKHGDTLASSNKDYQDCIAQFEKAQDFQRRLLYTVLDTFCIEKADMSNHYEGLIQDSATKVAIYSAQSKLAHEREDSAIKEAEDLKKEADTYSRRVKDLEDKLAVMKKASELSEKSIKDLSVQLESASEKSSMYDTLLEASKEKDIHIRDLEEQVRMLQKDLEHEKESAAQRIRIITLEAERKIELEVAKRIEEAAKKSVEEDLPFN